jgi:two-component sensor histidine kinase
MQLLFSVFNLGIYWGIGFAAVGSSAFIVYRQYFLFESMELINFDPKPHMMTFIVEVTLASFLLLYLIHLYLLTSRNSESALKLQNQLLQEKNTMIESQNDEKTIMLREIHHRVKNNLQVVNSLLRLQSYEIKDKTALEAFTISQNRVHAMALIHERLYQQDNLTADISSDYIEVLVHDLIDLYKNNQDISLKINFCKSFITQKNVVPFGLIVNELISNTLKHGIAQKGVIEIHADIKYKMVHFVYEDDGNGFSSDFKKGFGLELIETLAEQIDGHVTYENKPDRGLRFTFIFQHDENIKLK